MLWCLSCRPLRHPTVVVVVTGVLIALGVFVRLVNLSGRSLWDDEAWTYFISTHGWRHLLGCLPLDMHPPLFYLIEASSAGVSGPHELVLRLPSLIAGLLLIGLGIWIAKNLGDSTSALMTGA